MFSLLTIFTFYTVFDLTKGQTCFSQSWQSSGWIESFQNSNPLMRTFTNSGYSTQTYVGTSPSGPLTEYECLGAATVNNIQYHLKRHKTKTNDLTCESSISSNNGILLFTVPVLSASLNYCPTALAITNRAQWLPRRDLITGTTPDQTCPFPDGIYRATYSNSNQGEQCKGDPSSTISVSGSTMTTNLCNTNLNNYGNPLKGATIKCISSIQGDFLDTNENGLIILLQNQNTGRFYCARYSLKGTKHYLSLDIQDSNTPYCYKNSKFDTAGNIYLMLTLEKPCTVPVEFYPGSNTRWFYEYSPGQYHSQSFSTNAGISKWSSNTISETISCIDHFSSKDMNYFLMQKGSSKYCYEINYVNQNILIQRSVIYGSNQVKDCPNSLASISTMQVLTRYSSNLAFNLTPMKCPFFDGSYHVLYANNTQHDVCKGYQNSTADVVTDTMRVRTCTPTDTYDSPYYSDWTCYGTWRQDMTSFNSPSGGSEFLLLGYRDPTRGGRQTFFCSRFQVKINSAGYVQNYVSLDVNDPNKVVCDMSKDHLSKGNVVGNQFRAFLFIMPPIPTKKVTTRPTISTSRATKIPPTLATKEPKFSIENPTTLPTKNPSIHATKKPTIFTPKNATDMPTRTAFIPVTSPPFTELLPVTSTRPPLPTFPTRITRFTFPSSSSSATTQSSTATRSTASTSPTRTTQSSTQPMSTNVTLSSSTATTQTQCTKVCQNSGSCQIQGNQQVCVCQPAYTGTNCESHMVAGLCAQQLYWPNQTRDCIERRNPDYFLALCMTGFEGSLCQYNIDDCAEYPDDPPHCSNGGVCLDMVNDWQCACTTSWTGKTCAMPVGEDDSNNLGIIIGLIVGLGGVIVLIVIIAVMLCYYRDKEAEKEKLAENDYHSESVVVSSTSRAWYPDYKTDITQLNGGVLY